MWCRRKIHYLLTIQLKQIGLLGEEPLRFFLFYLSLFLIVILLLFRQNFLSKSLIFFAYPLRRYLCYLLFRLFIPIKFFLFLTSIKIIIAKSKIKSINAIQALG